MRLKSLTVTALVTLFFSASSSAQFEEFKDYELNQEVVSMTTVKVNAGKGEDYLEGLVQTWVASNQVAKDMGNIKDFDIYVSRLPESGDFNVVLLVTLESMGDYVWTKKENDLFRKKWGERKFSASRETAKTYPELRTIIGEYLLSRVDLK